MSHRASKFIFLAKIFELTFFSQTRLFVTLNLTYVPKVSVRPLPTSSYVLKHVSNFALYINPEVTVTESYIPEFSLSTFVADLGGSLGLWLGMGAVQIMSSGVALSTGSKPRNIYVFSPIKINNE